MLPILHAINQRGLLYFDSGSSLGTAPSLAQDLKMPFSTATLMLDESASRQYRSKFTELEKQAKSEKQAIGVPPYPVTFGKTSNWAIQLRARGFVLAPISALSQKTGVKSMIDPDPAAALPPLRRYTFN